MRIDAIVNIVLNYTVWFLKNYWDSGCIEELPKKGGAGMLHNYLYIHSPGGAVSVISFRMAVINWPWVGLPNRRNWDHSGYYVKVSIRSCSFL